MKTSAIQEAEKAKADAVLGHCLGDIEAHDKVKFRRGSTIKPEILRSAKLSETLKNFGKNWRISPCDLSEKEKAGLWEQSQPCQSIDFFLTHSWATPGWQKYIALCMKFGVSYAFEAGFFTFLLIAILGFTKVLPAWGYMPSNGTPVEGMSEGLIPFGCWATLFLPLAVLAGIFGSPLLHKLRPSRNKTMFLDVLCINQFDDTLRTEGVYSLAGFLGHSKSLMILWTPPYCSRLWCVFELAAYFALNPNGLVEFTPVFMWVGCLLWFIFTWMRFLIMSGIFLIYSAFPTVASLCFPVWLLGNWLVASVGVHYLRYFMMQKQLLTSQMEEFDCDKAECRLEQDKNFVMEHIQEWFKTKEKFNNYVREKLRDSIAASIRAEELDYRWAFMAGSLAQVGSSLDTSIASINAGRHPVPVLLFVSVYIFCVEPLYVKLVLWVAQCNARPRSSPCCDKAFSFLLTFLLSFFKLIASLILVAIGDLDNGDGTNGIGLLVLELSVILFLAVYFYNKKFRNLLCFTKKKHSPNAESNDDSKKKHSPNAEANDDPLVGA